MKNFKIGNIKVVNSKFIAKAHGSGFTLECYPSIEQNMMIGIACSRIELYNLYNVIRQEFKDIDPSIVDVEYWKINRQLDAELNDTLGLNEIDFICNNEDLYGLFSQLKEVF